MKVFAGHDLRGEIEHLLVVPDDGPPAAVAAVAGHLVTEIDPAGIELDATKPETFERLAETIRTYRVEVSPKGQLRKKR
jgi:hypothetical protein